MKNKISILLLVLLIISISQKAQSQWLTAGNTLGGTEKLGSINNQALKFYTSNTHRMTITSYGWVGIGTCFTATPTMAMYNRNNKYIIRNL